MKLLSDIISRIVGVGDKRLFVVENRDGFIMKHKSAIEDEYGANCKIFGGTSLDLRLVRDYEMQLDQSHRFIFVPSEDFTILDDIVEDCERVNINAQRYFSHYHWNTIKNLSLAELDWLYQQKQMVPLNAIQTWNMVCEYQRSPDYRNNAINDILKDWQRITEKIVFRDASIWMPELSRLLVSALKLEAIESLIEPIKELNDGFQEYLRNNYSAVANSGVSPIRPKIVSHIAPFIARQDTSGKYALVVVDGMNFWQAIILANAIEDKGRNIHIKYEASLSWLPSVTELSRQAIFRGDTPSISYAQSPNAEQKLWENFWTTKRVPKPNIYYQHSGQLTPNANSTRVGYVNIDLDEMMHGARSSMYLYEDTTRWVHESTLVDDILRLASDGYKIYLTTDHGNIETLPYRSIAPADKAGATSDRRYIRISEHADASLFENTYSGHVHKLSESELTYYAVDREIFSKEQNVVTHGGTHFLEVIIPFFTINSIS